MTKIRDTMCLMSRQNDKRTEEEGEEIDKVTG